MKSPIYPALTPQLEATIRMAQLIAHSEDDNYTRIAHMEKALRIANNEPSPLPRVQEPTPFRKPHRMARTCKFCRKPFRYYLAFKKHIQTHLNPPLTQAER